MTVKTKGKEATFEDYERELKIFQTNVNAAARAFYYHVSINQSAMDRPDVLEALNESARFWLDYRYFSMQSVFIVLGRIFDTDLRSHSVGKLLDKAESSRYFSKENLRSRKMSGSSNAHEWIDQYMDDVHEFSKCPSQKILNPQNDLGFHADGLQGGVKM